MKKEKLIEMLVEIINEYLNLQEIEESANKDMVLFGKNSSLDSIGFVNVIVDIESRLSENGIDISIISEQAMSQRNSPFRSIETLANFIIEQTEK